MREINYFLINRYRGIELITLFIGVYDKRTHEFLYINGGHCAPLLILSGTKNVTCLPDRSKVLGADKDSDYVPSRILLSVGDQLVLYTDGIAEINLPDSDENAGEIELIKVLEKNIYETIDTKIDAVIDYLRSFDSQYIKDDITIIGVEITE